jgi:hypothetical protein
MCWYCVRHQHVSDTGTRLIRGVYVLHWMECYLPLTLQIECMFGVQYWNDTNASGLHSITYIFLNYYRYLCVSIVYDIHAAYLTKPNTYVEIIFIIIILLQTSLLHILIAIRDIIYLRDWGLNPDSPLPHAYSVSVATSLLNQKRILFCFVLKILCLRDTQHMILYLETNSH